MLMVMIYPGAVVTELYSCAYVGNLCPRLGLVLCLVWLASVCFSGNKGCTVAAPVQFTALVLASYYITELLLLTVLMVMGHSHW